MYIIIIYFIFKSILERIFKHLSALHHFVTNIKIKIS